MGFTGSSQPQQGVLQLPGAWLRVTKLRQGGSWAPTPRCCQCTEHPQLLLLA